MRATALVRVERTEGERQAGLAYVALGLLGAGLSFVIALQMGRSSFILRGPEIYDLWLLIAGAAGPVLCLRQVAGRFGNPGLAGIGRALGGMAIVTFFAPIVTGTLILPVYGTMFGPFALAVTFAGSPFVALVWVATLVGVHALFLTLRAERLTLFQPIRRRPG